MFWLVTLPIGLFALLSAAATIDSAIAAPSELLEVAAAVVGAPLGLLVASKWAAPAARVLLRLAFRATVQSENGLWRFRVGPTGWRRSDARIPAAELGELILEPGQGEELLLWVTHRSGAAFLLATTKLEGARALQIKLGGRA